VVCRGESFVDRAFVADLTPFAAYKRVRLLIRDLRPATNATDFLMRTSSDAGVSYASAATDYAWTHTNQIMLAGGALTQSGDDADTSIKLSDTNSSAAGFLQDMEIFIANPSALTGKKNIYWFATQYQGANFYRIAGGGVRVADTAIDHVQLFFSAGNIAAGDCSIYGDL